MAKRFIRLRRDLNYAIQNNAIQNDAMRCDFKLFYSKYTSTAITNEFETVYVVTVFYKYSLIKPTLLYR